MAPIIRFVTSSGSKKGTHMCQKIPSKSLVREPPFKFSQQGPCGERCSFSRASGLSFIYIFWSPQKGVLSRNGEKYIITVHGAHGDGRST